MCSLMLSNKACDLYYSRFVTIPWEADEGPTWCDGDVPLDEVAFFHDWVDYDVIAFLMKLLESIRPFSGFSGYTKKNLVRRD